VLCIVLHAESYPVIKLNAGDVDNVTLSDGDKVTVRCSAEYTGADGFTPTVIITSGGERLQVNTTSINTAVIGEASMSAKASLLYPIKCEIHLMPEERRAEFAQNPVIISSTIPSEPVSGKLDRLT